MSRPKQEDRANWRVKGPAEHFCDSPALVITSGVKAVTSTGQFIIPHLKPVCLFQNSNSDYIQIISIRDFSRVMAELSS